jgi:membrane-associated phospholipid phosphatase
VSSSVKTGKHKTNDRDRGSRASGNGFWPSVAWVLLCLLLIGLSVVLDDWVANVLELPSHTAGREFARWVSELGEGWVIALAGVVGSSALFFLGRPAQAGPVFLTAGTGLLTGVAATVLRVLIGRTRPHANCPQGLYGVWHDGQWLVGKYYYSSFPSGHAATVFGLAAAVWLIDRRLVVPVAIYAVLVSWSRVATSAHHFSDIVSAALLGVFGAYWIVRWCRPTVDNVSQKLYTAWTRSRQGAREPPSSNI